ncbi:Hypothetical predicted protein, partial [Mytilus galloprovincialis]
CPSGWMRFGNSCYFYENTRKLPWDNATEYCASQGGYLAEITDEAEFQLVDSVITGMLYLLKTVQSLHKKTGHQH